MKTQTDMALIGLALVVVAVIALSIWNAGQVDMAAAQVGAQVAAEKLPEAAVIGGQVTGWALKTLIDMAAVAVGAALIAWVSQWWKRRSGDQRRTWKSGPNANWERGPRVASSDELMRMMMMQQLMSNRKSSASSSQVMPIDSDLDIDF